MQVVLDLVVLTAAFLLTYLLRFEFVIASSELNRLLAQWPLVVFFQMSALLLSGAHSFVWRYISLAEIRVFWKAALGSFLPLLGMRLFLPDDYQIWRVPISILVMNTILAFGGVLSLRVLRRWLYERWGLQRNGQGDRKVRAIPVLLVGAGQAGVLAAREILSRPDAGLEIKGFLDDDPHKKGLMVRGIKVLGPTEELPLWVRKLEVEQVIITIARADRSELQRLLRLCRDLPVKVRIIPGLYGILEGRIQVNEIRDVQIEDLLGRTPVKLDEGNIRAFLGGKSVLVTGAGGSIGSELCRQIVRFQPSQLLLVERAEFALFEIDQELRKNRSEATIVPLVADVGDSRRLQSIFHQYRPQVLFHAAAHKHVPMMEGNCTEAVKNNTLATRSLGELAGRHGLEVFVLISTDKAVNPTSVMGASKRLAELVVQDLNGRRPTRYLAVRFGNVLGSSGSVIPIFREQIRTGGPVTVTHAEMVRYFMTIPEASQLVLQAGAMGQGGEIFVLNMGEPVRIMDLAREMITLSGLTPDEDIPIICTGLRPGEKLFEEIQSGDENLTRTRHPKIFIGQIKPVTTETLPAALEMLAELSSNGRVSELRRYLNRLLPEARLTV